MRVGKDSEQREFELSLEDEQAGRAENREEEWSMWRKHHAHLRTMRIHGVLGLQKLSLQ